ncbi:MAG: M1 family aminopeptidase [Candidatus Thorarchaeota archaeon]
MKLYQTDEMKIPRFYNGDLWAFEADSEIERDQDMVIQFEYSGQIHPPKNNTGMPTMGYIKRDFVELACYSAWYPVPLSMETYMSYNVTLNSPSDWTWIANGKKVGTEPSKKHSVWTWNQTRQANDITLVGLPIRDTQIDSDSFFWGPKSMVSSQKRFDRHIYEMRRLLEEWLGPPSTNIPLKFVITPRQQGGAYTRSGMVVVGGGYPTTSSSHNAVLQAICHEICHEWFNRTSPLTYDNWVDEALAEFCSIHIVNDYVREDFLSSHTAKVREQLEKAGDLPAIRELVREQEESHAAFYFRGFLLLHEVSESVGITEFREGIGEFARTCIQSDSITSDTFLNLIQEKFGKKSRQLMESWLEYAGMGVPS